MIAFSATIGSMILVEAAIPLTFMEELLIRLTALLPQPKASMSDLPTRPALV
jgi:hypothetical protein